MRARQKKAAVLAAVFITLFLIAESLILFASTDPQRYPLMLVPAIALMACVAASISYEAEEFFQWICTSILRKILNTWLFRWMNKDD